MPKWHRTCPSVAQLVYNNHQSPHSDPYELSSIDNGDLSWFWFSDENDDKD